MQLVVSDEEDLSCDGNHEQQRRQHQQPSEMIGYHGHHRHHQTTVTGAAIRKNSNVGHPILSDDLRDQFETMKRISRQVRRGNNDDGHHGVDASYSNSNNNSDDKVTKEEEQQRATTVKDLKRKERDTAIETAFKVDNEINQWRDGIAHLEALLLAEEENSEQSSSSTENIRLRQEQHESGTKTGSNNLPLGIREIEFVAHSIDSNKNGNIVDIDNDRQEYSRPLPPVHLRFPFLPPPPSISASTQDEELDEKND